MFSRPYPDRRPPHPTPPTHFLPHGLSMDPSAVDFRAFYPYTPNEVKHRKRTTTTQLRTLEAIFKRDTKPNGPLRVELAAQLGMTARGVQVWFQNRRAKEKIKASKAAKADDGENQDQLESPDDDTPSSVGKLIPPTLQIPKSSSAEPSCASSKSPPSLHVVTEPTQSSWEEPNVDPQSLYASHNHLHAYRRGSLPVNAFPTNDFAPDSPSLDDFDPLTRRRSVDASLQRLANNPFAPLARAKNGAIYGPRAIVPIRRPCRNPYNPTPRITSMPYRLDMRRSSMGNFRVSPHSTASPSPSPLSPYNGVRASLPDHNLYTVSSRTVSPLLPGPLPSPNFSFGAASTPSMVSASSGDSERLSPEPHSYSYRESDQDEDEGTPASYYSLSRFGSIASIATSDSSINSAYFPEQMACYPEEQDLGDRRDSCASGHFTSLLSGLDVNGMQDGVSPLEQSAYTVHEEPRVTEVLGVVGKGSSLEASTYPSPTSTISPGDSPRPQGTPTTVPISRCSELNHALQGESGQVPAAPVAVEQTFTTVTQVAPHDIQAESIPAGEHYYYAQDANQLQEAPGQPPVELNKYHYSYDVPYLTESYPPLDGENLTLHQQAFEAPVMSYETAVQFGAHGQHIEQTYLYA
ncbi:hypothetical protein H0H87_005209 [Tephrocybe sp. NHM501043]|nr:hypothetical protein H0H87_005209 [Tephrocybe sp. NHM501043]